MRLACAGAVLVVAVALASCRSGDGGGEPPLTRLAPSAPMPLSPGNVAGQDEDPSILVARGGDSLFAAWYSNRAGLHPDGRERKELFVARSRDGFAWTDPPVQVTNHYEWSFYPSLAQTADGALHLTWMRWHLVPAGCVSVADCTGYQSHILYNRSPDGITWNTADEFELAGGPADELASIVAASDGRLLVYFSGVRDGSTKDIHVVVHGGTGWDPPLAVSTVSSATEHDTFPHVVERSPGSFLMAWTRYPSSNPDNLFTPDAETMLSTSSDGLSWTAPVVASGPSPARIDVFPYLYPDHSRQAWSVLWVTESGVVDLPVDDLDPANLGTLDIPGYTPRMAPSPTPGVYWAAWAEDVERNQTTQKIRQRFLAK